jgi:hypothetical protein
LEFLKLAAIYRSPNAGRSEFAEHQKKIIKALLRKCCYSGYQFADMQQCMCNQHKCFAPSETNIAPDDFQFLLPMTSGCRWKNSQADRS